MGRLEEIESELLDDRMGMTPATQRGIGWLIARLKEAKKVLLKARIVLDAHGEAPTTTAILKVLDNLEASDAPK